MQEKDKNLIKFFLEFKSFSYYFFWIVNFFKRLFPMLKNGLVFFILVFFIACANRPIGSNKIYREEEFVRDSMLIIQGKRGICQLVGLPWKELQFESMDESQIVDGDILELKIYNTFFHPWLEVIHAQNEKGGFVIIDDHLYIPYLGKVSTLDLSLEELKKQVDLLLKKEFPSATCFIDIKDRLKKRIELQGAISQTLPLISKNRTLLNVLTPLKGKEISFLNSYVKRDHQILPIDLQKLIEERDSQKDISLKEGDCIVLAEQKEAKIMVLGEVHKEGVYYFDSAKMSLKEALAKAGGILLSADRTFIQVIRGKMAHPKIYTLSYKNILRAQNDTMLVIPGDIVFVASTPIAEWNRLLNQLLPSITTYEFFHRGIQGVIIP